MAVRLSALRTGRTLLPRNMIIYLIMIIYLFIIMIIYLFLVLISVRGWEYPRD
jgi:hypothetical protein